MDQDRFPHLLCCMPAGGSQRFVPSIFLWLPSNASVCFFPHQSNPAPTPRTLPPARHVILSWVESFLYASGRGSWARLVTTHRDTWRREARFHKRCSRSFLSSIFSLSRIKFRVGHLPRTSWTRGLWIFFRACPFLGSWPALLCEEVHIIAG